MSPTPRTRQSCGSGFWGGQRPSLAHYVTGMGPMDGATAAGGRSCCLSSSPRGPNRAGLHLPPEALTYQANLDAIDEPADWILGPFSAGPRAGEDRITEPSVGRSSDDLVPVVVPVVQRNAIKSRLYQSINGSSLSVMDSKVPPIPRHADVEA